MHAKVVVNRSPYSMLPSPCSRIRVFRSVTSCRKLISNRPNRQSTEIKKFNSLPPDFFLNRSVRTCFCRWRKKCQAYKERKDKFKRRSRTTRRRRYEWDRAPSTRRLSVKRKDSKRTLHPDFVGEVAAQGEDDVLLLVRESQPFVSPILIEAQC